jgi:ubiquinone/menaquinone biosynthesis C-methylase UbiE
MKGGNWTGERLETHVFNDNTLEHLHRYGVAMQFAQGKVVLDIASGEGYGSNLLSTVASQVTGVDISFDAVKHANGKYKSSNLRFTQGSADKIPLNDGTVDVVVSFETIEHHDKHHEMFKEIKRVLKKDGVLIMSSPNKLHYTDKSGYVNPFHVKELYEDEFKQLVNTYFTFATFLHQQTFFGSLLFSDEGSKQFKEFTGDYSTINMENGFSSLYLLVVASDVVKHDVSTSIFKDSVVIKSLIEKVRSSNSYRIGSFILTPVRLFRKLFS